jgi:hypothetical protein
MAREQMLLLEIVRPGVSKGGLHISDHHRERLFPPAIPETKSGESVKGAADVHAPPAFADPDAPLLQQGGECGYRFPFQSLTLLVHEVEGRATSWAGDGLVVEASSSGILIFLAALLAHREGPHGGLVPVIGKVLDDGEPRAAVSAIGEWIKVPPVFFIEELVPAVFAHGRIVRDAHASSTFFARHDSETFTLFRGRKAIAHLD